MCKIAIVYTSMHHHNTQKVVEAMAEHDGVDLFDLSKQQKIDLSSYDMIGFASGIYFLKFSSQMMNFVQSLTLSLHQKVFVVYTYGLYFYPYHRSIEKLILQKQWHYLGYFRCRGYDTYAFLKKIGGIAKGHPNAQDLKRAREYIENL